MRPAFTVTTPGPREARHIQHLPSSLSASTAAAGFHRLVPADDCWDHEPEALSLKPNAGRLGTGRLGTSSGIASDAARTITVAGPIESRAMSAAALRAFTDRCVSTVDRTDLEAAAERSRRFLRSEIAKLKLRASLLAEPSASFGGFQTAEAETVRLQRKLNLLERDLEARKVCPSPTHSPHPCDDSCVHSSVTVVK